MGYMSMVCHLQLAVSSTEPIVTPDPLLHRQQLFFASAKRCKSATASAVVAEVRKESLDRLHVATRGMGDSLTMTPCKRANECTRAFRVAGSMLGIPGLLPDPLGEPIHFRLDGAFA